MSILPKENLREYIDKLRIEGYTVTDSHTPDPQLIDPMGRAVETWREGYPYPELMDREEYELEKYRLQVELLKFQYWGQDTDSKHVIVFEGRDAAGKGGTIKRFTEHLNPRAARVVALNKPLTGKPGSGTSSATSLTCPRTARSSCSTARGTTGPTSNASWASAPTPNTRRSWSRHPCSRRCSSTPTST